MGSRKSRKTALLATALLVAVTWFYLPQYASRLAAEPVPLYLPQPSLEAVGYAQLPDSTEIDGFLKALEKQSPMIHTVEVGRSAGGRPILAALISNDANFLKTGHSARGRLKVLLVGGQHGTEPSGTEALQQLAKDLLDGKASGYLAEMDLVLVPNANPDGRDNHRRVNQNEVNLSTDYNLLSQPETRALASVLRRYQPHVVLDMHESAILKKKSLGAQGYLTDFQAQFEFANHPNIAPGLRAFSSDRFLPELLKKVSSQGLKAGHYIGEIIDIHQVINHGGISIRNFRNYAGMHGALSMLVENRLDPPGEYPTPRNIKVRKAKQLVCIYAFLDQCKEERDTILKETELARQTASNGKVYLIESYQADRTKQAIVIPLRRRDSGELVPWDFRYHPKITATNPIVPPKAYLIRAYETRFEELLRGHGISYTRVNDQQKIFGIVQTITSVVKRPKKQGSFAFDIGIREFLTGELMTEPDDLKLSLTPENAHLAALILDPRASSSVFRTPKFARLLEVGKESFIVRIN
jgi:hypothetical protein